MAKPVPPPRRVRLCIVVQYPIHNHLPLHRALARDPGIDLRVLFMQEAWSSSSSMPGVDAVVDWGLPTLDGYAYEVHANASPWRDGDGSSMPPRSWTTPVSSPSAGGLRRAAMHSKPPFGIAAQRRVVLFCARFVAKKLPLMLVDAFLDAAPR